MDLKVQIILLLQHVHPYSIGDPSEIIKRGAPNIMTAGGSEANSKLEQRF